MEGTKGMEEATEQAWRAQRNTECVDRHRGHGGYGGCDLHSSTVIGCGGELNQSEFAMEGMAGTDKGTEGMGVQRGHGGQCRRGTEGIGGT